MRKHIWFSTYLLLALMIILSFRFGVSKNERNYDGKNKEYDGQEKEYKETFCS